jgi:hypothetical protein
MDTKKYTLNTNKVLFTPLEEEGVLYAIEENKYISLNESYTSIVNCIAQNLAFSAIVADLMSQYEVDQEVCENQLLMVIADLISKDYINEVVG